MNTRSQGYIIRPGINTQNDEMAPENSHADEHDGVRVSIRETATLASVLRVFGAATVIAAMSTFLMQDWSAGNDITRFYMMLAQTLLLATGGFGISYLLKENKGARVFFGLGLISITVNMATLGALVFSITQWGSGLVSYPGFAKWQSIDIASLLLALGAGLAVCIPAAVFGYLILVRRSVKTLALLCLFTNALLLFPVRESLFVGVVALLAILVPAWYIRQRIREDHGLHTPEGWFAIASVFAPAIIIVFRSVWLYPVDAWLQLILAGIAFALLRLFSPKTAEASVIRMVVNWLAVGAALSAAIPAAEIAVPLLSGELRFTVFSGVFALLLLDIAERSPKKEGLVMLASMVLAGSHILPVMLGDGNALSPILCILSGIAVLMVGLHYRIRTVFLLGVAAIVTGMAQQVYDIVMLIDFSNWITLAVLGVSIIVAASVIERHGAVIRLKWAQFRQGKE